MKNPFRKEIRRIHIFTTTYKPIPSVLVQMIKFTEVSGDEREDKFVEISHDIPLTSPEGRKRARKFPHPIIRKMKPLNGGDYSQEIRERRNAARLKQVAH